MIVKKEFYCIQEKKTYKVGTLYNGKRKDINNYLEEEIEVVAEVVKPKAKKNKK